MKALAVFVLALALIVISAFQFEVTGSEGQGERFELTGVVTSSRHNGVPHVRVESSADKKLAPAGAVLLLPMADEKAPGLLRGDRVDLLCTLEYLDGWSLRDCRIMQAKEGIK
jgi:hypothetical protein